MFYNALVGRPGSDICVSVSGIYDLGAEAGISRVFLHLYF